jgi:hypothetical protein
VPELGGVVEFASDGDGDGENLEQLIRGLVLDRPAPGLAILTTHALGGQVHMAINVYLYGSQAAETAARVEPLWSAWMKGLFPSAA